MLKKFSVIVLAMLFVLGMATAAFAASYNNTTDLVYYGDHNPADTELVDALVTTAIANDNGMNNANGTGNGVTLEGAGGQGQDQGIIKNVRNAAKTLVTQATHGSYQNNTNSCASCHQTHTGAGETLLFKDSVYNTCTACHDGTLGIYNVFGTQEPDASLITAGTFGGTIVGNASMHLANGSVEINAAPGGKAGGEDKKGGVEWADEFSCASCHAPHGSYSDRLLQNNANGIQTTGTNASFDAYDEAGRKAVNVNVYGVSGNAIPDPAFALSTDKIVLFDTETNLLAAVGTTLADYNMTAAAANPNIAAGDYVALYVYPVNYGTVAVPNWKWSVDTTPWLYGYETRTNGTYSTQLKKDTVQHSNTDSTQDTANMNKVIKPLTKSSDQTNTAQKGGIYMFGKGYMFIKASFTAAGKAFDPLGSYPLSAYKWMDVSQANVVTFDFKKSVGAFDANGFATVGALKYKVLNLYPTASTKTYTNPGAGTKLSSFCSSCHVDYMVSAGSPQGTYTQAYRHNTSSSSYACLICHYAHGTDVNIMMDSMDQTIDSLVAGGEGGIYTGDRAGATAYLLDTNPSSALKRYTNMSVCWKCHTSSHAESFLNGSNDFYNNYDSRPHGY